MSARPAGTYYARWTSSARVGGINNAPESSWAIELKIIYNGVGAGLGNSGPSILPATIDIVARGYAYSQNLNSSDPDGTPVNYAFVGGTNGGGAAAPNYGPTYDIPGISVNSIGIIAINSTNTAGLNLGRWVYKVRVTDGSGATAERDVLVVAQDGMGNSSPVLNAIGSKSVSVNSPLSFAVTGSDPDSGQTLTLRAQGLPAGATFPQATAVAPATVGSTFNWTPPSGSEGNYQVNFEVYDSATTILIASELVQITVSGTNTPPTLNAIGNKTVANGATLSFSISGSDPDAAQTVSYQAFNMPSGASFAGDTFTWTPSAVQYNNVYTVTFRVRDNGTPNLTADEIIYISVGAGNQAPGIATISDVTVHAGETLQFTVTATDSSLSQVITLGPGTGGLPAGATFPVVSGTTPVSSTFTWTPTAAQAGHHHLHFRAEDNGSPILTSEIELNVDVELNAAPVSVDDSYNATEDTALNVAAASGVLFNDTDDDGNALSAILVTGPTNASSFTLNSDGSFDYTAAANFSGTDSFSYKANDGTVDGNTVTVSITIASDNDLPTISAIADLSAAQEVSTGALPFTVGDVETSASALTLSKASTNTSLVPLANIVLGGTDANRTVTVTPATGQSGTATITLTVTDGGGGTASESFVLTVVPRPIIAGFNPATGGGVGTSVGITISNHVATGPITDVTFNGFAASFTQSGSLITATVPNANVNGYIRVTSAGGTGMSATTFTLIAAPVVGELFSPNEGGYGTTITISGANLANTSAVKIGNFNVPMGTHFTQVSNSQIKIVIPVGSVTGKISVTTPGGTDVTDNDLTVHQPPQIGSFSPASGNIGALVTISGAHLGTTQLIRFNTQHTTAFTILSANQVRVAVPAGATTGKITVQTKGGTVVSTATFTVILRPSISSFTPTSGAAGTLVTLSGNNLSNVAVSFNGTPATSVTQVSAFQVRAVVPAGATTGRITCTNTAGDVGTSNTDFTVLQGPAITGLNPTSGQAGTGVVISGSNFTNVASVKFNGTACTFTVNNAGQITATVPVGATTGKVTVTNNIGTGTSVDTFTISTGTAAPVITSFSPTSGAAGATVTLTGTGFLGTTLVQFTGPSNTLVNANFRVDNAQKITCTVPASAVTGPILVTTAGGMGTTSGGAGNFTVLKYPVIFSFTPTTGPAGTSVTITGANFTGTSSVKFATPTGTVTAGFTLLSATSIRTNVPLTAVTGKISITNGFGTGQSTTDFLVAPRIDSFSPTIGPVGTVVTITGRAFTGATAVQFNGELAEFTVVSATQITATVPAGASSGVLTVNTPSGVGNSSASFNVTP